ncbi:MAG TPA: PASTA domain-containing protein [Jatrophihabitans sp.]
MGKGKSPWQDGRRAWERLNGWHQDKATAVPGHPDDGDLALDALADVGVVRRLLDQAEMVAVRTARSHGKSWTEVATRLGVTRQSAWERWRDLDDTAGAAESTTVGDDPARGKPVAGIRATVVVPDVVGMTCDEAIHRLFEFGLVAVGPDPDGPPLTALAKSGAVVIEQSPRPGTKVPPESPVTLLIERRGGGTGVREPRRPRPDPKAGYAPVAQPSGEAVN